jgi:hypothetical protein
LTGIPWWHWEQGKIPSEKGGGGTRYFLCTSFSTGAPRDGRKRNDRKKTSPIPDAVHVLITPHLSSGTHFFLIIEHFLRHYNKKYVA